jgi:hypothetical protein
MICIHQLVLGWLSLYHIPTLEFINSDLLSFCKHDRPKLCVTLSRLSRFRLPSLEELDRSSAPEKGVLLEQVKI